MVEKTNLEGKKHCIHKKLFFGMVDGRCVKCGGWLTSLGQNPKPMKTTIYEDILEIIKTNSPYWESEDKDDYMYILKKYNVQMIAHKINGYMNSFLSKKYEEK